MARSLVYRPVSDFLAKEGTEPDEIQRFTQEILDFLVTRGEGTPDMLLPVINGKPVDLRSLYERVTSLGGMSKVTRERKWGEVAQSMGVIKDHGLCTALLLCHDQFLYDYERHQHGESYPPKLRQRLDLRQAYLLGQPSGEPLGSIAPSQQDALKRAMRLQEELTGPRDTLVDAEALETWPGDILPPPPPRHPPRELSRGEMESYSSSLGDELHGILRSKQPWPAGTSEASGTHVFAALRDRLKQKGLDVARIPPKEPEPRPSPQDSVKVVVQATRQTTWSRVALSLISGCETEVLWALNTLFRAVGPNAPEGLKLQLPENPGLLDSLSRWLDECDIPLWPRGVATAESSGDDGTAWVGVGCVGASGMDRREPTRWSHVWSAGDATAWAAGVDQLGGAPRRSREAQRMWDVVHREERLAGASAKLTGYGDASRHHAIPPERREGEGGRTEAGLFPMPRKAGRAKRMDRRRAFQPGWVDEATGFVHAGVEDEEDALHTMARVSDRPWQRWKRSVLQRLEGDGGEEEGGGGGGEPPKKRRRIEGGNHLPASPHPPRAADKLAPEEDPLQEGPGTDLSHAIFPWAGLAECTGHPLPEIYTRWFPRTAAGRLRERVSGMGRRGLDVPDSLGSLCSVLAVLRQDPSLEDPLTTDFSAPTVVLEEEEKDVFTWGALLVLVILRNTSFRDPNNAQSLSLHPRLLRSLVRMAQAVDQDVSSTAWNLLITIGPMIDLTGRRYAASMAVVLSGGLQETPRNLLTRSARLFFEHCARSVLALACDGLFATTPRKTHWAAMLLGSLSHQFAPENKPYLAELPTAVLQRLVTLLTPPVPSVEALHRAQGGESVHSADLFNLDRDLRHRRHKGTDPLLVYDQWDMYKRQVASVASGVREKQLRHRSMVQEVATGETPEQKAQRREEMVGRLGRGRHAMRGDLETAMERGRASEASGGQQMEATAAGAADKGEEADPWGQWFSLPGEVEHQRRHEAWQLPVTGQPGRGRGAREQWYRATEQGVAALFGPEGPRLPVSALERRDDALHVVFHFVRTQEALRSRLVLTPGFMDRIINCLTTTAGPETAPTTAAAILFQLACDEDCRRAIKDRWLDRLYAAMEASRPVEIVAAGMGHEEARKLITTQVRVYQALRQVFERLMLEPGLRQKYVIRELPAFIAQM